MKKIIKANEIKEENIKVIHKDEEIIQLLFKSANNTSEYLVSKNEYDYWRCDCPDYTRHNSKEGSYICKHIIKALYYLDKNKEL